MNEYHTSVLLQEVVETLQVRPGNKYIDATLGGGGHTKAIIDRGGIVLGIDQDEDALDEVRRQKEKGIESELQTVLGNFNNIKELARKNGFVKVSGILFDLGVSSHQLDTGTRGFSFNKEAKLDMRMDKSLQVSAKDLVNGLTRKELQELFETYGQEPFAKKIAQAIVDARKSPIETTTKLAHIITKAIGYRGKMHPATKVFQALRMAVNDELHSLTEALPQAVQLLEKGGRLVVISFHSLEDKIVKNQFEEFREKGLGMVITKKPIESREEEIHMNPRSRSAKMRIFEVL